MVVKYTSGRSSDYSLTGGQIYRSERLQIRRTRMLASPGLWRIAGSIYIQPRDKISSAIKNTPTPQTIYIYIYI